MSVLFFRNISLSDLISIVAIRMAGFDTRGIVSSISITISQCQVSSFFTHDTPTGILNYSKFALRSLKRPANIPGS